MFITAANFFLEIIFFYSPQLSLQNMPALQANSFWNFQLFTLKGNGTTPAEALLDFNALICIY